MDYTQELLMFQGVITSADSVHKFSRITSKGGNEDKVDFVIDTIKRFLTLENYIDENGLIAEKVPLTRKFALYIVLNADLAVLQDMMDVTGVEPVIWTVPTIPQYLMCEMIWQLHMEKFLYEIVPNCWPQLGLEISEAFLENFKYLEPTECLGKLQKLSMAVYGLICRLTCFKFEDDSFNNLLAGAYGTFEKYLRYYIEPPKKYKLDVLNDDDLFKYKGERFKSILFLVNDCCNIFDQALDPNCGDIIYKSTHRDDCFQNTENKVCETPNKLISECLSNSNTYLLDVFKVIVMDVSVDTFCAWSEYEENDKTFQQIIGELCYKVGAKVMSINSLKEHPVLPMIKVMARKPSEIKDIINSMDTEIIVQKIKAKDKQSQKWIRSLLHKEGFNKDMEITKLLYENLNLFKRNECLVMYNAYIDVSSSNLEFYEVLMNLKVNLFDKFSVDDKMRMLNAYFSKGVFKDTLLNYKDLECKLNEIFNKFVADADVNFSAVVTAFFQSPKAVFTKIFSVAVQNPRLIHPMIKLMMIFKDFMKHYYPSETDPCVIVVMKSVALNNCPTIDNKNNLAKFITELKDHNIVPIARILITVVMPSLHYALVNDHILLIQTSLKILLETFRTEEIVQYRAPLLVMMGQIMDAARSSYLEKFSNDRLQALELAIHYTKLVLATYRGPVPEGEGNWLRFKIKELDLHPLNAYYFKIFWNVYSSNYFEVITNQRVYRKANLTMLATNLFKILPWATLDEWCDAWYSFLEGALREKHVLHLYYCVIDEFTKLVQANRSESSVACLFNCYKNLVHIIRFKFLRLPLANSQVKTCVHLLSLILNRTDSEYAPQFIALIGPLLAFLVGRKREFSVNIDEYFINNPFYEDVKKFIHKDKA